MLPFGILLDFPIWLASALCCVVPTRSLGDGVRWAAAALYLPLPFWLARQKTVPMSNLTSDYVLALATWVLLWVLLSAKGAAQPSAGRWISRILARFTYTLYVVHVPFLLLLAALFAGHNRWQPDVIRDFAGAGILAMVIGYAFILASVTEFHTYKWRRWIESALLGDAGRSGSNVKDPSSVPASSGG